MFVRKGKMQYNSVGDEGAVKRRRCRKEGKNKNGEGEEFAEKQHDYKTR
jgi:hypothetical protein